MNGGTLKRLLCGLLALLLLSVPAGISADSIVTINHGGQPQETEAPAAEGAETEAAIPEAEPTAEPAQAAPAKADVSLSALRGYDNKLGYVYVTLGEYPQAADGGKAPILWRVLAVEEAAQRAYLLSEYILFARCMHANLKEYRDTLKGDFGQTDLCAYLNTTFSAEAFTEAELSVLTPLEGAGLVFLISDEDANNKKLGLGKQSSTKPGPGMRAWGTAWAIENNGFDPTQYTKKKEKLVGSSNKPMPLQELRLFVYSGERGGNSSPYWTRSQAGVDKRHARCTKVDGQLGHIEVGRDNEGVRPAVYLDLTKAAITGGSGTADDPYVIGVK